MPRLIDHDQRSVEVVEAAWRVLVQGGVQAVSVRNVAAEAGLATGSLRRAFPTQASLLAACLGLMGERVAGRIRALSQASDPISQAEKVLAETLPLDPERRLEMEVYLTLGTAALSDPQLKLAYTEVSQALARLCRGVVAGLSGTAHAQRREIDAVALNGLLDGLALQLLHGGDPDVARAAVRRQLECIATAAPQL